MNSGSEYRDSVGAVIINRDKRVLLCQRSDRRSKALQMPQGGVDPGEEEVAALYRELYEELNTANFHIIARSKRLHRYTFPPSAKQSPLYKNGYKGQQQRWFLLYFLGQDTEIDVVGALTPEFSSFGWYNVNHAIANSVPFKRRVYREVFGEFRRSIEVFAPYSIPSFPSHEMTK